MEKKDSDNAVLSLQTSCNDGEIIKVTDVKLGEADVALGFIEQHEGFTYTPDQEKAVLRKIDFWLMPLVSAQLVEVIWSRVTAC